MIVLWTYLIIGSLLLTLLVSDVNFNRLNLLASPFESIVFIWAWPCFLMVLFMFKFCRDEDAPVVASL